MRSPAGDKQARASNGLGQISSVAGTNHHILARGDEEGRALDARSASDRRHSLQVATRALLDAVPEHPESPVHKETGELDLPHTIL